MSYQSNPPSPEQPRQKGNSAKLKVLHSVVIPVRNAEKFLEECLASLPVGGEALEFIFLDHGSVDRSLEMLESFCRQNAAARVLIIDAQFCETLAEVLNYGVSRSSGKFISRMDADDVWLHERTEFLAEVQAADSHWAFGKAKIIDEHGRSVFRSFLPPWWLVKLDLTLLNRNKFICHPATTFSRDLFDSVGGYSLSKQGWGQDKGLWLKYIDQGVRPKICRKTIIKYRIGLDSVTGRRLHTVSSGQRDAYIERMNLRQAIKNMDVVATIRWLRALTGRVIRKMTDEP